MVLLWRKLYFPKDPEGDQHFPGRGEGVQTFSRGGGGPTFARGGGGPNANCYHNYLWFFFQ